MDTDFPITVISCMETFMLKLPFLRNLIICHILTYRPSIVYEMYCVLKNKC